MIELAVTIDAGEPSVKACYTLEGDGPLALSCYEVFSTVRASLQVKHWANTRALAWMFAAKRQLPALKQQLMTYALTCVQTGFTYFERENCCLALKPLKLPVCFSLSRSRIFIQMLPQLTT